MATSAVAQVCWAFRVASLSSVEHLCVEVRGSEEEPGVVLPRWAALATTLRRLTSLRTLGLRLFTLRPLGFCTWSPICLPILWVAAFRLYELYR